MTNNNLKVIVVEVNGPASVETESVLGLMYLPKVGDNYFNNFCSCSNQLHALGGLLDQKSPASHESIREG